MHSVSADKQNPPLMFSWGLGVLIAIYILVTIHTILRVRPCQLWQDLFESKKQSGSDCDYFTVDQKKV